MKNIAIVTGASSGMGRRFALTLKNHASYDEVWVIARSGDKLAALQEKIPFPVRPIALDLTSPEAAPRLQQLLQQEQPRVKLLINGAGYGIFDRVETTGYADSMGMLDLNCRALTVLTLLCLPYLDAGSEIINIASVAAFQPIPCINIYGATKAYVLSFSRALNRELKSRKIRVFAVCPFWTKTGFFDRAIRDGSDPVVKKYAAMYTAEFVVQYAWNKLEKTGRDYCIPGAMAKLQVLGVKLLPHSLVMSIWQRQQKLK